MFAYGNFIIEILLKYRILVVVDPLSCQLYKIICELKYTWKIYICTYKMQTSININFQ